jgi:hypothetical protein
MATDDSFDGLSRRSFLSSTAQLALAASVSPKMAITQGSPQQPKVYRLPEDLSKIIPDSKLLQPPKDLTVAAYTFPNYHASALHDRLYAPGWTEYNLLRGAHPWFEGHQQPRTPMLGELDERKPSTWEKYNSLAKTFGVDVLIWDWYWYDGGPALHEALEEGFLLSKNRNDVKFAIMWTNHPWYILYPTLHPTNVPSYPPSFDAPDKSVEEAWRSLSYIVSRYFHQPNYWRIDGKPVLCIWDPNRLQSKLGLDGAKRLIADLREFAKKLGHPGIHVHSSGYYSPQEPEMGFDTCGSYNPLAWVAGRWQPKEIEIPDYGTVAADVIDKLWPEHTRDFKLPYLPAIAPGWDSSPRYVPPLSRPAKPNRDQWPRSVIFKDENPGAFEAFLKGAFAYLNTHPKVPPIVTIACWNEWTEGHYLLPDTRYGHGMLEAVASARGIKGTHEKIGG